MCSVLFHNGKGLVTKIVTSASVIDTNNYCGLFITTLNKPNIFFSMDRDKANVYVRDLCKNKSISVFEYRSRFIFDDISEACSDEDTDKILDSYIVNANGV